MRGHSLGAALLIVFAWTAMAVAQSSNFPTSLHATRAGKDHWYGAANGGFETFTGVSIEDLGCKGCHGPVDANGDPYTEPYTPGCGDCHSTAFFPVEESACLGCHGRQKTEMMTLGLSDVHRSAGMKCWDCHSTQDIHGDGTAYSSMLEAGAVDVDCADCHGSLPLTHVANDPHGGKVHCASCHAQTVISCYNCHFESLKDHHIKRAKQPLSDFVMLVNREKDGKVHPASFQSITYQGNAFVAFGPYNAHAITRVNARRCPDCHQNYGGSVPAIEDYNNTGKIHFATWNDADSTLSWLHGVVPIPEDYPNTLRMDFLTFMGDPSSPPGPSKNWASIGKDVWDGSQMFFATPLTRDQMMKLGFTVPPVPVTVQDFAATVADGAVVLAWRLSHESVADARTVYVQRATSGSGPFTTLTPKGLAPALSMTYRDPEVSENARFWYRLQLVDAEGETSFTAAMEVQVAFDGWHTAVTPLADPGADGPIAVRYSVAQASEVRLEVYDVRGRLVRVLERERRGAGTYLTTWDRRDDGGNRVARGAYFVRLHAGRDQATGKVVVLH